jgi:hypothetical protein
MVFKLYIYNFIKKSKVSLMWYKNY